MDDYTKGVVDGMEVALRLVREERIRTSPKAWVGEKPATPPRTLEDAIQEASDRIRLGVASLP